jgi:hypothetical protein
MRIVLGVSIGLALAACGGSGGGGDDGPAPDADTSLCAGRACLVEIDTAADWDRVTTGYVGRRCDFLEDGKYLAPAVPAATLPQPVFQDVNVHRLHLDFMTAELPEYFGGLTPAGYQELVQRRATRQYWAGSLYRLVDESGATTGYGFDVITDPTRYEEDLVEAEVAEIQALLEARFHLPLVYAPTTDNAIYTATNFAELAPHFPRPCHLVTCANPSADCVEVPEPMNVCGQALEGRTIQVEHARKATLAAVPGTHELPRADGTYTIPAIFAAGELGPARTPIAPAATATYVVTTGSNGYRSYDYTQSFTVGGQPMELVWRIWLPEGGGGYRLAEPYADTFGAYADIGTGTSYDDVIGFTACGDVYQHWRLRGEIAGTAGDGFTIDVRYEPPSAGSGPMHPRRAEVTLGGQTTTVTDYFDLAYAGVHHNWDNQWWVLFDAPVTYQGHAVHGLWLDEQPYQFMIESAHTLDAARLPLDELTVTDYAFELVAPE